MSDRLVRRTTGAVVTAWLVGCPVAWACGLPWHPLPGNQMPLPVLWYCMAPLVGIMVAFLGGIVVGALMCFYSWVLENPAASGDEEDEGGRDKRVAALERELGIGE